MLPCIQWLHKMHWLCEQDKHTHTHTLYSHTQRTCPRNNADVEGGCSTCAVMADDLKRTQSINPPLLFCTDLCSRVDREGERTPCSCTSRPHPPTSFAVLDLRLNRICMWPQPSHTFHNSIGKIENKQKGVKLLKRIDTLLQNIH